VKAEARLASDARRLWGRSVEVGIHDTWHFESADMCDMNHGSLDLWESVRAKTGGFVDLGGVQVLADSASPAYANLAALSVTAASLGKMLRRPMAWNNLWTVGEDDGDGSQYRAMDHCVKVMALFGTRWLAHAYGPVGTVGQERSFLGSPPLPGYPDHSTWRFFPEWNKFLGSQILAVEGRLPKSNILVLFPTETLYGLGDTRADGVAGGVFDLLLALLDNHYHVDLIGSRQVLGGRWKGGRFVLGPLSYETVVFPYPGVIDADCLKLMQGGGSSVRYVFGAPAVTTSGKTVRGTRARFAADAGLLLSDLSAESALVPVRGPRQSWITMTPLDDGLVVSLAPSRAGLSFGGVVEFGGRSVTIEQTGALVRIHFPPAGAPRLLTHPTVTGER
jgi:hypothetical protein